MKKRCFAVLHEIFHSHYIRPESQRINGNAFDHFGAFYGYSEALQSVLAPDGQKLYSPAAELIKRQADRTDLPFSVIMEAELLILLLALISQDVRWYPQTLYYNSQHEFPFFIRATQHKHFLKLSVITEDSDANHLRHLAKVGYERMKLDQMPGFAMMSFSVWSCLNMDALDSLSNNTISASRPTV